MYKSTIALVFSLLALFLFTAAPLPSSAQAATTVTGTVADENGAPISGATVTLRGPSTQSTSTDVKGLFQFANVAPGIYVVAVSKAGYTSAVQTDVAVLSGQTANLAVRMGAATFSSLRTIASVRTNGRGINTSASSVNVVTTQTFEIRRSPK